MGREAKLSVDDGTTRGEARVHLDSEMLTIGPPFRLKLKLDALKSATASPEGLAAAFKGASLSLAMSEKEATAWAKSMLNPPSLETKLGLKPGTTVAMIGPMPTEIDAALKPFKPTALKLGAKIEASLVCAAVPEGIALKDLAKLSAKLGNASAWLVYAKGGAFNGDDLIFAARAAGLKDTKVSKVSDTHTALRFIAKA